MKQSLTRVAVAIVASLQFVAGQGPQSANEELWEASRVGDVGRIQAALARGADVNAKARYDVTALFFAASSGRAEAVRLLLARGADVNAQDTFYRARATEMALTNGHAEVAVLLLQGGAHADGPLAMAVQLNLDTVLNAALSATPTREGLASALSLARTMKRDGASRGGRTLR